MSVTRRNLLSHQWRRHGFLSGGAEPKGLDFFWTGPTEPTPPPKKTSPDLVHYFLERGHYPFFFLFCITFFYFFKGQGQLTL